MEFCIFPFFKKIDFENIFVGRLKRPLLYSRLTSPRTARIKRSTSDAVTSSSNCDVTSSALRAWSHSNQSALFRQEHELPVAQFPVREMKKMLVSCFFGFMSAILVGVRSRDKLIKARHRLIYCWYIINANTYIVYLCLGGLFAIITTLCT